jgi:hypothetical protein
VVNDFACNFDAHGPSTNNSDVCGLNQSCMVPVYTPKTNETNSETKRVCKTTTLRRRAAAYSRRAEG